MRRLPIVLFVFLTISAGPSAPAAAQDVIIGRALDWWKLDPNAVTFLCLPDRKPVWCADAEAGIRPPPPPQPPAPRTRRGETPPPPPPPPKSVSDTDWDALVDELATRRATPLDIATIEERAFEDRDPIAFEMLGFIYATGRGPTRDYATAYQYYGLALVAGRTDVRTNLDEIWRFLDEAERRFVRFRFERAFP